MSSIGSSCTGGETGARVKAVHLVPNTKNCPVFRATMQFLNVSSVPDFGLFSLPLRHFSSQTMCSGFVSDLPNQILLSYAVSPYGVSFLDDNPRCSGAKILNKTVSANGTISCVQSRSLTAPSAVMPPAPRAYLVTQNLAYLTIHGQIAESRVIRVL